MEYVHRCMITVLTYSYYRLFSSYGDIFFNGSQTFVLSIVFFFIFFFMLLFSSIKPYLPHGIMYVVFNKSYPMTILGVENKIQLWQTNSTACRINPWKIGSMD